MTLSDDDLVTNNLRYFSQLVGKYKLGYGIDLRFQCGYSWRFFYLGDMFILKRASLIQEFPSKSSEKQQFFDGDLSYREKKSRITR